MELSYQEVFDGLCEERHSIERSGLKYFMGVNNRQFKQLQDEIKANGCKQFGYRNSKIKQRGYISQIAFRCMKYGKELCPTCQNLIKQIEELL